MSDHSVSCTITNNTTGTIVLGGSAPDSGTDLSFASNANSIASGVTVTNAFTASGGAMQGCGGSVTYNLPNNVDVLILYFNTNKSNNNSYCFPVLQSTDSEMLGCDSYYCSASNSVSLTEDDGLTAAITINDVS